MINLFFLVRKLGKMVYIGVWYDGWEIRRYNIEFFDWVVICLGVSFGIVEGIEVDIVYFNGNYVFVILVEGCFS